MGQQLCSKYVRRFQEDVKALWLSLKTVGLKLYWAFTCSKVNIQAM